MPRAKKSKPVRPESVESDEFDNADEEEPLAQERGGSAAAHPPAHPQWSLEA